MTSDEELDKADQAEFDVEALSEEFFNNGSVSATDGDGRLLTIISSTVLGLETSLGVPRNGVFIAYEGRGAYFWEWGLEPRPLNKFQLFKGGFDINIAPTLADTLNQMFANRIETINENNRKIEDNLQE